MVGVTPVKSSCPILSLNLIKPLDLISVYREHRDNKESYKEINQEVGHSVIQPPSLSSRSLPWKKGVGIPLRIKRDSRDIMSR